MVPEPDDRLDREVFVHFTERSNAEAILAEGYLRLSRAELAAAVFAISATFGDFAPAVQHAYIRRHKIPERLQAATLFTTSTPPVSAHAEEVVWHGDVLLKDAILVSAQEARSLLGHNPLSAFAFARYEEDPTWGHDGDGLHERLGERVPGEGALEAWDDA